MRHESPGGEKKTRHRPPTATGAPSGRTIVSISGSFQDYIDVCALPPRSSSEHHLADQLLFPSKLTATRGARRAAPRPPAPGPADDARRLLLSDIGFTSMVPELSRSADPVWALGLRASAELGLGSTTETSNCSKFVSRSCRSPCVSVDRSYDRFPQSVYTPPKGIADYRLWRGSLPDVRRDDTDELLAETESYLRRSIDNLRPSPESERVQNPMGQPYIPAEPRQLRLGHAVKVIAPHGRVAVGRVRYVGIAGGTAATSGVMVGAEFPHAQYPGLPRNDGTHRGRRYFLAPAGYTALFVPFTKVVMAWAN